MLLWALLDPVVDYLYLELIPQEGQSGANAFKVLKISLEHCNNQAWQQGAGDHLLPLLTHEITTIESEILCYPKNMSKTLL